MCEEWETNDRRFKAAFYLSQARHTAEIPYIYNDR